MEIAFLVSGIFFSLMLYISTLEHFSRQRKKYNSKEQELIDLLPLNVRKMEDVFYLAVISSLVFYLTSGHCFEFKSTIQHLTLLPLFLCIPMYKFYKVIKDKSPFFHLFEVGTKCI